MQINKRNQEYVLLAIAIIFLVAGAFMKNLLILLGISFVAFEAFLLVVAMGSAPKGNIIFKIVIALIVLGFGVFVFVIALGVTLAIVPGSASSANTLNTFSNWGQSMNQTGYFFIVLTQNTNQTMYNINVACDYLPSLSGGPIDSSAWRNLNQNGSVTELNSESVGATLLPNQSIDVRGVPCYGDGWTAPDPTLNQNQLFTGGIFVRYTNASGQESTSNPWQSLIATNVRAFPS